MMARLLALALPLLASTASAQLAARPDLEPKFATMVAEICVLPLGAVDCFAHSASLMYAMCGLVTELAIVEGNFDRVKRCTSDARTHITPPFEHARRETAKSKEAAGPLKDACAYWLTAMDELMPRFEEARLTYRQRLARQKETLDHKMNRLKLEK